MPNWESLLRMSWTELVSASTEGAGDGKREVDAEEWMEEGFFRGGSLISAAAWSESGTEEEEG